MGTIKADTVTGLADPNKVTLPSGAVTDTTLSVGSTTATLNFGNTVIANASAGSTTVTAEGGSTTTNLQQGLCKHWIDHNDGATVNDSFNNTSLTDDGTGQYTATIANDFNNTSYAKSIAVGGSSGGAGDNCFGGVLGSVATGSYSMYAREADGPGNVKDSEHSSMCAWGDLA